jgi:hypothetical protein
VSTYDANNTRSFDAAAVFAANLRAAYPHSRFVCAVESNHSPSSVIDWITTLRRVFGPYAVVMGEHRVNAVLRAGVATAGVLTTSHTKAHGVSMLQSMMLANTLAFRPPPIVTEEPAGARARAEHRARCVRDALLAQLGNYRVVRPFNHHRDGRVKYDVPHYTGKIEGMTDDLVSALLILVWCGAMFYSHDAYRDFIDAPFPIEFWQTDCGVADEGLGAALLRVRTALKAPSAQQGHYFALPDQRHE